MSASGQYCLSPAKEAGQKQFLAIGWGFGWRGYRHCCRVTVFGWLRRHGKGIWNFSEKPSTPKVCKRLFAGSGGLWLWCPDRKEKRAIHHKAKKKPRILRSRNRPAVPQMRVSIVGRGVRQRGLRSVLMTHTSRPMTKQMRCCRAVPKKSICKVVDSVLGWRGHLREEIPAPIFFSEYFCHAR